MEENCLPQTKVIRDITIILLSKGSCCNYYNFSKCYFKAQPFVQRSFERKHLLKSREINIEQLVLAATYLYN